MNKIDLAVILRDLGIPVENGCVRTSDIDKALENRFSEPVKKEHQKHLKSKLMKVLKNQVNMQQAV
jgi:hypothetical protein